MAAKRTPSQTVGPFFGYGLAPGQYGYPHSDIAGGDMAPDTADGQRIRIVGQVLDGAGVVVPDALIEIWQANARGRYDHPADAGSDNLLDPAFTGFGRVGTGTSPDGHFEFQTVKPGSVDGHQAPHLNVVLFMRGLLRHVFTRIYFSDEEEANRRDPVLLSVPEERRRTLIAERDASLSGQAYGFDIHMQGARETAFLDV